MAEPVVTPIAAAVYHKPEARSWARALLLTLPIFLWSLLMFSRFFAPQHGQPPHPPAEALAGVLGLVFMTTLFALMMKTRETYRWRRIFFVALGFLFPVGFIYHLLTARGSMSIPVEEMIAGRTPFCFMPIPMLAIPAALTRTIAFPGSIEYAGYGIASMVGLWLALSIVIGKGWCAYGCFFGGLEEGFSSVCKRPLVKLKAGLWKLAPWAVLLTSSLLTLALFEPFYCSWLCPFKAVTEYPRPHDFATWLQVIIFGGLFLGLVVVLPILSKRRTQCGFFCPFGAFQSLFNKVAAVDIRIDKTRCTGCQRCAQTCPNLSLSKESIAEGRTLLSCMKCGACVDVCPKGAALYHIRGTECSVKPERARLLFLYGAWMMAVMFGGSIIANSLSVLLGLFIKG